MLAGVENSFLSRNGNGNLMHALFVERGMEYEAYTCIYMARQTACAAGRIQFCSFGHSGWPSRLDASAMWYVPAACNMLQSRSNRNVNYLLMNENRLFVGILYPWLATFVHVHHM